MKSIVKYSVALLSLIGSTFASEGPFSNETDMVLLRRVANHGHQFLDHAIKRYSTAEKRASDLEMVSQELENQLGDLADDNQRLRADNQRLKQELADIRKQSSAPQTSILRQRISVRGIPGRSMSSQISQINHINLTQQTVRVMSPSYSERGRVKPVNLHQDSCPKCCNCEIF